MTGRIRTLKPEWLEDEPLMACSDAARVLSAGLLLLADDYGNGRGSPKYLGAQVFPGEPLEKVQKALKELEYIRYVIVYNADSQTYFSIRNWDKHQKVSHKGKPRVPRYLGNPPETLRKIPEDLSKVPETLRPDLRPHTSDHDHDQQKENRSALPAVYDFGGLTRRRPLRTETTDVAKVRLAYLEAYLRKYGKPFVGWGSRENGQAKNLLKSWPVARILELMPLYFDWNLPGPIKAGHPFGVGHQSFFMQIQALEADTHAPERHKDAAILDFEGRERDIAAIAEWSQENPYGLPQKS